MYQVIAHGPNKEYREFGWCNQQEAEELTAKLHANGWTTRTVKVR